MKTPTQGSSQGERQEGVPWDEGEERGEKQKHCVSCALNPTNYGQLCTKAKSSSHLFPACEGLPEEEMEGFRPQALLSCLLMEGNCASKLLSSLTNCSGAPSSSFGEQDK
jgi:hypothetical protein